MKNLLRYSLSQLLVLFVVITSCGNDAHKEPADDKPASTADTKIEAKKASYDFEKPEKREMKKKLKEISGIYYIKDDVFAAIQDESGKIFLVSFSTGEIMDELNFGPKGDYEDVAVDSKFYYVLESTGIIYQVPKTGDMSQVKTFQFSAKKHVEFESLYLDASGENLVMICKNCPGKKNNLTKYAYSFNLATASFGDEALFTIDLGTLPGLKNPDDLDVKPSATAIHPIEKKLYVLCSVGKMLLKCDLKGKIEQAWQLNPQIYKQPEGIAFTPNGDMYISNEAADEDKGNMMKLVYSK